tara:strand:- start:1735 stop:1845 length:111 start_codon:yes stop_codon:yes gene_type:complete
VDQLDNLTFLELKEMVQDFEQYLPDYMGLDALEEDN